MLGSHLRKLVIRMGEPIFPHKYVLERITKLNECIGISFLVINKISWAENVCDFGEFEGVWSAVFFKWTKSVNFDAVHMSFYIINDWMNSHPVSYSVWFIQKVSGLEGLLYFLVSQKRSSICLLILNNRPMSPTYFCHLSWMKMLILIVFIEIYGFH